MAIFDNFGHVNPPPDKQLPLMSFAGMMDMISTLAFSAEQEDNRAQAFMAVFRKACLFDDSGEYLKKIINEIISHPKQKEIMLKLMDTTSNIVKLIINAMSKIYSLANPTRSFGIDNEETQKFISEIYQNAEINERLDQAAKYLVLLNDCILLVNYDIEKKKIRLELLDRENAQVECNDQYPNEIEKLYYDSTMRDEKGALYKIRYVYTATEHYYIIGDNYEDKHAVPGNPEMINPLGVIPVVCIHRQYNPRTFWNSSLNNDLFTAYLLMCFFLTCKNYAEFMNAFKMIFILGAQQPIDANNQQVKLTIGPGEVVVLPGITTAGAASFNLVDFSINFENLWTGIRSSLLFVLQQWGMNENDFELSKTKTPQAGVALTIKKSGELTARKELIPIFQKGEKNLFDLIRIIWNYYNSEGMKIPEEAVFEIVFPEIENFKDEKERYETLKQRVKDGIMHAADFYMAYNQSVKTREEAIKAMTGNMKDFRELMGIQDYIIKPGMEEKKPEFDDDGKLNNKDGE